MGRSTPKLHWVNYLQVWKYFKLRATLCDSSFIPISQPITRKNSFNTSNSFFSLSFDLSHLPVLHQHKTFTMIMTNLLKLWYKTACASYTSFSLDSSRGSHSITSCAASTLERGKKGHIHWSYQKIMKINVFHFLSKFKGLPSLWGRLQLMKTFCLKP